MMRGNTKSGELITKENMTNAPVYEKTDFARRNKETDLRGLFDEFERKTDESDFRDFLWKRWYEMVYRDLT